MRSFDFALRATLKMTRALAIVVLMIVSAETLAFRCGVHLIKEGDHYIEVLKKCGKPTLQERWIEEGIVSRQIHPSFKFREYTTEGVLVQLWTYNFGTQKFMRQLKFRNGFLEDIQKIDYGF